jgi:hypothetical protein
MHFDAAMRFKADIACRSLQVASSLVAGIEAAQAGDNSRLSRKSYAMHKLGKSQIGMQRLPPRIQTQPG